MTKLKPEDLLDVDLALAACELIEKLGEYELSTHGEGVPDLMRAWRTWRTIYFAYECSQPEPKAKPPKPPLPPAPPREMWKDRDHPWKGRARKKKT